MGKSAKTVGGLDPIKSDTLSEKDPLNSVKREAVERMKAALLSCVMDDPVSTVQAMRQVTILRIHHQITRIVQYLDIMDKLESKLYESIQVELETSDVSSSESLLKLLAIQEKLQKTIIESNKLLSPYLDMEQYPAFNVIEASTPVSAKVLEIPASERNLLRENAGAILSELAELDNSNK